MNKEPIEVIKYKKKIKKNFIGDGWTVEDTTTGIVAKKPIEKIGEITDEIIKEIIVKVTKKE